MNLTTRTVHAVPTWCSVGATVRVDAPTCLKPITGVVLDVEGYVVTVHTRTGMAIAADIEDCRPST